ncbi:uncharacterized protein LOC129966979 [Argiope bruennichi]|uniref:uncharacterized protein LOC129966979 n=1 Tax=Argiope bruennichi TaxID=94029 RepID=UPI0024946713|nr:uncharacterized protein LOC129966979 [Argiope bruennichi]
MVKFKNLCVICGAVGLHVAPFTDHRDTPYHIAHLTARETTPSSCTEALEGFKTVEAAYLSPLQPPPTGTQIATAATDSGLTARQAELPLAESTCTFEPSLWCT